MKPAQLEHHWMMCGLLVVLFVVSDNASAAPSAAPSAGRTRSKGAVYNRSFSPTPFANARQNPHQAARLISQQHLRGDRSAIDQQRRKLAVLSQRLHRDLERLTTAGLWQAFLHLPPELTSLKRGLTAIADPTVLHRTLARFTATSENKECQSIAQLGSFRATHRELEIYIAMLATSEKTSATTLPVSTAASIRRLPAVLVPTERPVFEIPPESGSFVQP